MRTTHRVMRTIAGSVPLVLLLGVAPGWAQRTVYYHAGSWYAFTDKDAQGTAVCGIGSASRTDSSTLSMTYTIGGSDLTIRADKPSWNIPDGTSVDASTQIDQDTAWSAQADGQGSGVEWTIGAASIRDFDTQFRNGSSMTVSFPSGNEPPWTRSLSGSTAASATLWRCVQDLSDRAHVTTPATNMPPPTQPFGQAPTQPNAPAQTSPAQTSPAPASSAPADTTPAQTGSPPAGGTPAPTSPAPAATTPAPTSPAPASSAPAPAQSPAPATKP
jgi:hypothetical protein